MAKRHGSQEDFLKIPILGLVPESSATGSPPGSPVNGQLWFDTTVGRLFVREAGAWVLATQTGTVLATDSAGGDITGVFSNLQIGALAVGTAELAADAVTYAKMQNISATNRLLAPVTRKRSHWTLTMPSAVELFVSVRSLVTSPRALALWRRPSGPTRSPWPSWPPLSL
jgi:hypothetical protein